MKTCPQCNRVYDDTAEVCVEDGTLLVTQNDPLIGQLLAGRFRLTEKIGQGGMGAVYKAIQVKIERVCAVKLLTSTAGGDSQLAVTRFSREAQMASHIDNPHAVTIYDFGESEGGAFFLAMEYVDGESVSQILERDRPLPLARVVHIIRQIAEALASAHALGIVHRDLKPDNVMITQKGSETDYVKVLDFGIAKAVADDARDKLTETGFVLGTPIYMSPEQLSGEKLDARSDVYSLALIAYEMLSGRLPFEGGNAQAITIKRVTTDPIPLRTFAASLSPEIERVIMSGLTRDPCLRTPTVELFARDLGAASGPARVTKVTAEKTGKETVADGVSQPNTVADSDSVEAGRGGEPIEALPPSAYVTRASSSIDAIGQTLPHAAPTVRIDKSQVSTPLSYTTSPQADNYSTVHYGKPAAQVVERPYTIAHGRRLSLAVSIALVAVLACGAAAYFIFFQKSQAGPEILNDKPGQTDPTPQEDLEKVAAQYYESGKKHHKQAENLARQNSAAEAVEEYNKAIEEYLQAVTAKPRYPEAYEDLGVSFYYTGPLETAIRQFQIAIDQYADSGQPPPFHVYVNYGLALYDSTRYAEAAEAFGRAMELNPSEPYLVAHRGFALHNAGQFEAAKADYRKYLELASTGSYARPIRRILDGKSRPPATSGNR